MPPEQKAMLNNLPPEQKEAMQNEIKKQAKMMEEAYFWFKDGGIVEVKSPKDGAPGEYDVETGKWSISDDGNELTMTKDSDGDTMNLKIKEISASKLVLVNPEDSDTPMMIFKPFK